MRTVTAMGVALGVLGFATVVTLFAAQQTATGQQAAKTQTQSQSGASAQAPVPAPPAGQRVERQIVVRQNGPGGPAVVLVSDGGPRLGIEIHDVTKEDVAALKLQAQQGVVVGSVTKDSAAEKAGVKAGDVIVVYDGENVRSAQQLTRLVSETAPGRTVKLALVRDGKRIEIEATPSAPAGDVVNFSVNQDRVHREVEREMRGLQDELRQYRFERPMPAPGEAPHFQWFSHEGGPLEMLLEPGRGRLGVTVLELTPELAGYFGVKDGVLVASVVADTPAAKAGIKAGDIITTVNDKAVTGADELVRQLADRSGEITIGLTRDKKPLTMKATIEAPKPPARRTLLKGTPA